MRVARPLPFPVRFARACYISYVTAEQKLQLLETTDIAERLETAS